MNKTTVVISDTVLVHISSTNNPNNGIQIVANDTTKCFPMRLHNASLIGHINYAICMEVILRTRLKEYNSNIQQ